MCGRFINAEDREVMEAYFHAVWSSRRGMTIVKTWNAAPTQSLPIITQEGSKRWLAHALWGWSGPQGRLLVNARGEEAHGKRTWAEALRQRRCVVPATGFYEWRERDGQPFVFRLTEPVPMAIGGLWQETEEGVAFILLTTLANRLVAPIHHRMALILERSEIDSWLSPDLDLASVQSLIRAYPEDRMQTYPVSKLVNKVGNNGPGLANRENQPEQQSLFD